MNNDKRIKKYDDIINLPHHTSKIFSPMAMSDRAAQFSPFAALTGHMEAIKESERFTNEYIELTEEEKERLDEDFRILLMNLHKEPKVCITYFVPDRKKEGGEYLVKSGIIRKYREFERLIELDSGEIIEIKYICRLESDIINDYKLKTY